MFAARIVADDEVAAECGNDLCFELQWAAFVRNHQL
jgi:hypothetical protein